MEDRQFKVFEEPVLVTSDLITETMVREELNVVLNQRVAELEDELRREAAMSGTRGDSYNEEYPPIREAISSVDVTNLSQEASITCQLNSGKVTSSLPVEGA